MKKSKTNKKPSNTSQAITQAIFEAWFDNASGLIRPRSIHANETGELFKAILSELTANVIGADSDQDLCEVLTSLGALTNDLERVRAAVSKLGQPS